MTNPAFGPYGEPAFTVDYGNSGLGKSMDKLRTFPLGLYLAPPGGLKPAVQQLGYKPQTMVVQTLADCHAVALDIHQRSLDYEALVIDDASIILDNTATALAARYKNGIQLHGKVLEAVKAFRQLLRQMGLHAALNFHERQPATYDGEFFPGGPKLPSKGGTKEFPHIADLVTRAKREPNRRPWTGVYECDPHSVDYFQKDRFGVCPAVGPLNTGEILRRIMRIAQSESVTPADREALVALVHRGLARQHPGSLNYGVFLAVVAASEPASSETAMRQGELAEAVLRAHRNADNERTIAFRSSHLPRAVLAARRGDRVAAEAHLDGARELLGDGPEPQLFSEAREEVNAFLAR